MRQALGILFVGLACLAGCRGEPDAAAPDAGSPARLEVPRGEVLQAAENEREDGGPTRTVAAVKRQAKVVVPGGRLVVGSTPGDKGRDPTLEPALLEVDLGPFEIDELPYPGDPGAAALTGVDRARAAQLCDERGARLCTELEWERACKGPESSAFAASAAWDPNCAKEPNRCASGFGVLAMGGALREWTSSEVLTVEKSGTPGAAVRGASAEANGVDHRCAHRAAVDPQARAADLGFRCCWGPRNAATIPAPSWGQTYQKVELTAERVATMFESVPQLKSLASQVGFFREKDDVDTVMRRGDASSPPPNTEWTTSPVLWNPVPGEEVLVFTGKSGKDSFIVAFHRLPKDRYRLASSFVMKDERGPVVLGVNGYLRRKIAWSTCMGCPGEGGAITYREDNRVVITQH